MPELTVKDVRIVVIPHEAQRYETCGDWVVEEGDGLTIYVSDMGNVKEEMAVAIHELIEALLCLEDGVTQEEVDEFDQRYEANRPVGDDSEPGDDTSAPYFSQHQAATIVERSVVSELGLNWNTYEEHVLAL